MRKSLFAYIMVFWSILSYGQDNRTIDGSTNNLSQEQMGAVGDQFARMTTATFVDGIGQPFLDGPNPRVISNRLFAQDDSRLDGKALSDFTWVFGQFIKNEVSSMIFEAEDQLTNIIVPEDDNFFEPGSVLHTKRAKAADGTGITTPRTYINEVTAFVDGSSVYGSTHERAAWLRTGQNGMLKTSEGNLLPWNTIDGEFNSAVDADAPTMRDETKSMGKYFVAGDIRANEHPLLIAMHTLFVREHNRLCEIVSAQHPLWNDERVYQRARKLVGGILQNVVYNEWLPTLGLQIPMYSGYKPQAESRVSNEFVAAAFEIASTLANDHIVRMDYDGSEMVQGNITLGEAFYYPENILYVGGIDAYVKGMATQVQQNLDCKVIDAIRNFEYSDNGGTDRAAVIINKGRDTGLPSYNQLRRELGFALYRDFGDLTVDTEAQQVLRDLYGSINNVDAWVGLMAEDHLPNSMFGEVTGAIIERQFQSLRDGDRYFYLNDPLLSTGDRQMIESSTMSDLVLRNTGIDLMQDNVFQAMSHENLPAGPVLVPLHLEAAVYPNPTTGYTLAKVYLDIDGPISYRVVNTYGQTILSNQLQGLAGDNFIRIHLDDDIVTGAYHIVLSSRDRYKTLTVVKQ